MIKTVVLIPVRDNDGKAFPRTLWRELADRLTAIEGGYSYTGKVKGEWVDKDGTTYTDWTNRYEVALTTWRNLGKWLAVVDWAREAFRQEAMYVEVAGVPEILRGG